MNTTDQAFIRAYGSDFVPSNADEAARAANYSALADNNVLAVFGSMPQKHIRVDGPAAMPRSVAPQVTAGAPQPPVSGRAYVPQQAAPAPPAHVPATSLPPATQPLDTRLDTRLDQAIGQPLEHPLQGEATVEQRTPVVEQIVDDQTRPHELDDDTLQPAASHPVVPRPRINFATVQSAQSQTAEEIMSETPEVPEQEQPQTPLPSTLRSVDGLSVLADSSVLIGSSNFQWPTTQPDVTDPPTIEAPETLESGSETETQTESPPFVEDTKEVETNVTPPSVAPAVEDEEPDSKEIPPLNSTIANIDKDVAGLEVDVNPEEPVVAKQELKPAWEVDHLIWPNDVDQLYESESEYFRHAGEKLRNASHEGLRVLGVSATNEGEGCTTLAICLARAAAEAGAKVALLDANLRSPQLGAALGLDFARSWHETLSGSIPLAEAAVTAIADNVTLIPLSKSVARQGLTLDGDLINDILCQASEAFDLVLVDLGVPSTDGRSCFTNGAACPLDAAIIVRDVRVTSEEETLESVSRFRDLGIDAVGIAENFAPAVAVQSAA